MASKTENFRTLILGHVESGKPWHVVAAEFDGEYKKFEQWLDNTPLDVEVFIKLHEIALKWLSELETTARNKKRNKQI